MELLEYGCVGEKERCDRFRKGDGTEGKGDDSVCACTLHCTMNSRGVFRRRHIYRAILVENVELLWISRDCRDKPATLIAVSRNGTIGSEC